MLLNIQCTGRPLQQAIISSVLVNVLQRSRLIVISFICIYILFYYFIIFLIIMIYKKI